MNIDIQVFAEKYEEQSAYYPEYLANRTLALERKINKVIKYNQRLLLNDGFAHVVVDKLLSSKELGTRGLIAMLAIIINYKQTEGVATLKKIIKDNEVPPFSYYLLHFLRERKLGDQE